jgi:hypothetical protein
MKRTELQKGVLRFIAYGWRGVEERAIVKLIRKYRREILSGSDREIRLFLGRLWEENEEDTFLMTSDYFLTWFRMLLCEEQEERT